MREGPGGFVHLLGLPFRALALGLIGAYRLVLSPVFGGRCRFHPSCSEYAQEAIRRHGALKGSALAGWRVLRCSPLSAGGLDPVPAAPRGRRAKYVSVTLRDRRD